MVTKTVTLVHFKINRSAELKAPRTSADSLGKGDAVTDSG